VGKFSDFVTGKRIALVGPAATLAGSRMGAFIDDHDIVVRLNHSWPLPEAFKADIGARIDVIYHNMNFTHQRMTRKEVVAMHRDGVKWMISTHPASEERFRPRLRKFQKINKGLLEFRALPGSLKTRMQRRVKHPNAGIMAIEDLLRFPIERLYVTGFSFYTTGYLGYSNYKPSYAKKAVRHHDQKQNKSYLCRIVAREDRLEVDPVIARLLQEHLGVRA